MRAHGLKSSYVTCCLSEEYDCLFRYDRKNKPRRKVSGERTADSKGGPQRFCSASEITENQERAKNSTCRPLAAEGHCQELAVFFRQVSVMLDSGLPVGAVPDILAGNHKTHSTA